MAVTTGSTVSNTPCLCCGGSMSVHHASRNSTRQIAIITWTEGLLRVSLHYRPTELSLPSAKGQRRRPSPAEIAALGFILGTRAQFVHSSAVISLGPFEPLLRQSAISSRPSLSVHEGHHHRNFAGLFPLFDIVFGTAYFPKSDETINIGLRDKYESMTLWQYLFALKEQRLP